MGSSLRTLSDRAPATVNANRRRFAIRVLSIAMQQDLATTLQLRREVSLTMLVRQEIERAIEAGELQAGDWINEAMLASRLGVSRGPVREACRGLEQSGLVRVVVNRGAFVREITAAEAADLYELRAALFGYAGLLLAPRRTDAQLAELRALHAELDAATDELDRYYPLNLQFHALLLQYSGNVRLARDYAGAVRELHLFRRRALITPGRMSASNAEHAGILAAIEAGDPVAARELMERHVIDARDRVAPRDARSRDCRSDMPQAGR